MIDVIARILHAGSCDCEMTITPTAPDLGVKAFQVALSRWPHERHAIGRARKLDRAIELAVKQWRAGRFEVLDEEDDGQ